MHGRTLDRDALIRAFQRESSPRIQGARMPVPVLRAYSVRGTAVPYFRGILASLSTRHRPRTRATRYARSNESSSAGAPDACR